MKSITHKVCYGDKFGDKIFWREVGVMTKDKETGEISVKINLIPAGSNWNGWLNCFEYVSKQENSGREAKKNEVEDDKEFDFSDDIPF